jgi:hypothetical protein
LPQHRDERVVSASLSTRLAPHRQAVQEFITTRQGYRLATSNGGVLAGRGADMILIDDPLKPEAFGYQTHPRYSPYSGASSRSRSHSPSIEV